MEIEEDDLEKRQSEVTSELRKKVSMVKKGIKQYLLKYIAHKNDCFKLLSGLLEKVAAGSLVIAFLPDKLGWRPFYALGLALVCYLFAVKFHIDSKE